MKWGDGDIFPQPPKDLKKKREQYSVVDLCTFLNKQFHFTYFYNWGL